MLKGKNVLLGVTGSIAAYKIATLASSLKKLECNVDVMMTQNATNFINPITFESLTGNKCVVDTFDRNFQFQVEHAKLRRFGIEVLEPASGYLACGDTGAGKMPEPSELLEYILRDIALTKDMKGYRVCITAGPTQEAIDPVRYISNHSTGKMGYALAKNAMLRGAEVTLIAGPTNLPDVPFVKMVHITSAQDMYEAVTEAAKESDIIVKAAAVADYRPASVSDEKIKKSDGEMSIALERTKDIIGTLGAMENKPFLCGFSMETQNVLENSRKKLEKKNLDMVIANNLKVDGAGFGADTNVITMITKTDCTEFPKMSKFEVAGCIFDAIIKNMKARRTDEK